MPATDSHVAMLRGAIALAWTDSALDADEIEQLEVFIEKNMHLSQDQRQKLKQDISQPVILNNVWPHITDKQDRAHLINIACTIFWQDEVYHAYEKKAYDQIMDQHLATLDIAAMQDELRQLAVELRAKRKVEEKTHYDGLSWIGKLIYDLRHR